MKNILLIEPFLPYPLDSGGAQAIFNGIKAIEGLFDNIYVTFYTMSDKYHPSIVSEFEHQFRNVKVIPYVEEKKEVSRNYIREALSFLYHIFKKPQVVNTDPFDTCYGIDKYPLGFLEEIQNIIKNKKISTVQIEMPWLLPLVLSIPKIIKKVFVHHEIGFVRNELSLKSYGENLYRRVGVELSKIIEIGLLNKFDAIITLSPVDKNKLEHSGVIKPIYSSFAIVNSKPIIYTESILSRTISFVGPEFHTPNKVGVLWFLDNCWQEILSKDPDFHFQIIGKWNDDTINELSSKYPNLIFTGFVEDLSEALKSTILIVPITIGSGIRMKILEASSFGVPFVTTTVGVEGLDFKDGRDCFITDDPHTFVEDIFKLYEDKDLREGMIHSANLFVKRNYSLEALEANKKKIFQEIEQL